MTASDTKPETRYTFLDRAISSVPREGLSPACLVMIGRAGISKDG